MRIYISGPITANPSYEEDFKAAQTRLEMEGFEAVNPVELTRHLLDRGLSPAELWKQCMDVDLAVLRGCDMIALIDRKGLESRGMDVEMETAERLGIPVVMLEDMVRSR